jgi:predicted GNAT family acetyltransferase
MELNLKASLFDEFVKVKNLRPSKIPSSGEGRGVARYLLKNQQLILKQIQLFLPTPVCVQRTGKPKGPSLNS